MKPVNVQVSRLQKGSNFVRFGVPFPKGAVNPGDHLAFYASDDTPVKSVLTPTAHWNDGSTKWCLAKLSLVTGTTDSETLTLKAAQSTIDSSASLVLAEESNDQIKITSGKAEIAFSKSTPQVFPTVHFDGKSVWKKNHNYPVLTASDGSHSDLTIDSIKLATNDGISASCVIEGSYLVQEGTQLNAKFTFEILPDAEIALSCVLHNRQRAAHPGGIWDLGDPGSILFKDFSLVIETDTESAGRLKPSKSSEWIEGTNALTLFQASSGGKQWDSPVHANADGKVCNKFKGYKILTGNETLLEGDRSEPTLEIVSGNNISTLAEVKNFWQNFPKSIDIDATRSAIGLFPQHHGDLHELQGGERKTHTVYFRFQTTQQIADQATDQLADQTTQHRLSAPLAVVEPSAYREAGVIRYFNHELQNTGYENLITLSMDKDKGFFAKRDQLDEFGWRNYGEVYADHETAFHTGEKPFVSHYNNQYDCIWGFARQFALTGNPHWYQLMSELAEHILDIDIYRTSDDRAEYNNGLFWHTDHYAQACTATHRTFSATQVNSDGRACTGGGPGPQHCYSNGLVYYYYMTGCEEAKEAVLGLGEWIHNYFEGTGSVIEAAKKTLQEDTKNFISTCKGAKVFRYTYPMDRGTGNYMRTLMDCYEISGEARYLHRVERIINNTAGPTDEIDVRGFEDVENTWFYVIFLQDVIRYLDLKRDLDQMDNNFYYARATLLHYAKWMVANDKPYLHSADKLDHPNATWVAQEPRKVQVLYAAYKYALKDRSAFLEKAKFFRDYFIEELSKTDTLHYARIQVLLLQNHGPSSMLDMDSLPYPGVRDIGIPNQTESTAHGKPECFHTPATHLKYIAGNWVTSICKFRIGKELRWIKTRAS